MRSSKIMEGVAGSVFICVIIFQCLFASPINEINEPSSISAVDEEEVRDYLEALEINYSIECNKEMTARWAYITNVTDDTEKAAGEALNKYLDFQATVQNYIAEEFSGWDDPVSGVQDPKMRRELRYLSIRGPANMSTDLVAEMNQLKADMESAYGRAWVCNYECEDKVECSTAKGCQRLELEPDLETKLREIKDNNFDELEYYWSGWHDALSKAVPTSKYRDFIALQNVYANSNGKQNMEELWAEPYDDGLPDFNAKRFADEMYALWESLRPYYNKVHAYVRMKLRQEGTFGDHVTRYGYMPANIFGNMWAQDWTGLDELTKPFPDESPVDATQAMKDAGYNETYLFDLADKFFVDLGLTPVPKPGFREKSMLVKPEGRNVICHASAEDFCNGEDWRIKMCTEVNQDHLVTVHHEMGHIQYFMQYKDQHFIFREGANFGFHEAIGDALALAVTTPYHLQCVLGLKMNIPDICEQTEPQNATNTDLNFLYRMALEKFSFFPFAISMDSWRWGVFNGSIPEEEYNSRWWEIRERNQGITPPSKRDNSEGLDAAAKYHIVGNVEYIRYFISHILQFQFYEKLCTAAGQYTPGDPNSKPLYQCDFNGNKDAGKIFGDMMKLGFSVPWTDALKILTGSSEMSTKSLINYFEPLFDLIDEELELNGEIVGFGPELEEAEARNYVNGDYELNASKFCRSLTVAQFDYETDLNNETKEEAASQAGIEYAQFELAAYNDYIKDFHPENIPDASLSRQIKFMRKIGTSALNDEDLKNYTGILARMSNVYGTAKVCPYDNQDCDVTTEGLTLEPDLTRIFSEMKDLDELRYLWKAWRDATGPQMRTDFTSYVQLSNKAAQANGEKNMGDFWLLWYESDTFREDMEKLWGQVKPLYEKLYAYVRFRMSQAFPDKISNSDKPLQAHMFGNMWAQSWENLLPFVIPFPDEPAFDVTRRLQHWANQYHDEYDKRKMLFDMANAYFSRNLGLERMDESFGRTPAMIMKPDDREVVCHASAWDFCDGEDYRIKMCTEVNHNDLITVHHELGHIQYFKQYKDLPYVYRTGANPGFHEAIGDVIALSVSSPKHLNKVGLIDSGELDEKTLLNYQMQMALDKVAFLPFGYMIDLYRWRIFDETTPIQNLTRSWLLLRAEYQNIIPAVLRNEDDFDAGAKYHIPGNTPYIRYFVSFILQFQLHKALCEKAGSRDPLYNCNIGPSPQTPTPGGEALKKLLQAGGSQNWQDVLEEVAGTRQLDGSALLEYFEPLDTFLDAQQVEHQYSMSVDIGNIDQYMGSGSLPTSPNPVESTSDPTTDTTEASSSSTVPSQSPDDDDKNNTVAIVVGCVLGVAVVVIVVGYFVGKRCRKNRS